MDISLAKTTQKLINEMTSYLDNLPEFKFLDYSQRNDQNLIHTYYSNATKATVELGKLIIKAEYFISKMKIASNNLSTNTKEMKNQKTEVQVCINSVKELLTPLYTERERLTKIYYYYDKIYKTYVNPM